MISTPVGVLSVLGIVVVVTGGDDVDKGAEDTEGVEMIADVTGLEVVSELAGRVIVTSVVGVGLLIVLRVVADDGVIELEGVGDSVAEEVVVTGGANEVEELGATKVSVVCVTVGVIVIVVWLAELLGVDVAIVELGSVAVTS